MNALEVRRVSGALGAELHGIDVAEPLSADATAQIASRLARASRHLLSRPADWRPRG